MSGSFAPAQSKAALMRDLHSDPGFAIARDERARDRFTSRNAQLQRKSAYRRRGVDVPPELEDAWRACKRKRMSSQEAARFLRLPWKGGNGRWRHER